MKKRLEEKRLFHVVSKEWKCDTVRIVKKTLVVIVDFNTNN